MGRDIFRYRDHSRLECDDHDETPADPDAWIWCFSRSLDHRRSQKPNADSNITGRIMDGSAGFDGWYRNDRGSAFNRTAIHDRSIELSGKLVSIRVHLNSNVPDYACHQRSLVMMKAIP